MLGKKTILTAQNINNAFISKIDTNAQMIQSNLTVSGGQLSLKNSVITDNAGSGYLRIDPQGNNVIVYDGINNQQLSVYSSSGSESIYLTTINGTPTYSLIDISSNVDHLSIMGTSGKKAIFGGDISVSGVTSFSKNLIMGNNVVKHHKNLATYGTTNPSSAGAFIIDMPFGFIDTMMTVTIKGYFYDATSPFEMVVGFYPYYTTVFQNVGFINTGSNKLQVRLARRVATNTIAIILGNEASSYPYPQIVITDFIQGFGGISDSYGTGWVISQATSLSAFDTITTVPDKSGFLNVNNMGGGSGWDTDMVDGKHFSDIQSDSQAKANTAQTNAINFAMSYGLGTSANSLASGTDLNTIKITGFYRVNAGVNVPPRVAGDNTAIWHYIIVIQHDNSWVTQIALEYSTGTMFTRAYANGTAWTSWRQTAFDDSVMHSNANTSTTGSINIGTGTIANISGNGDGSIRVSSTNGYMDIGPKNGSYSHIYTDRPSFYFNKDLYVNGNKVWHQGNDGPGSALDADTVDTLQSSQFLRSDIDTTSSGVITSKTLKLANDATDTFNHRIALYDSGSISYGMMLWNTSGSIGSYSTMIYGPNQASRRISFGKINSAGAPTGNANITEGAYFNLDDWTLHLTNNAYVNGNIIWHSGNDGSGSNLDADMVDGIHASQFVRSDIAQTIAGSLTLSNGPLTLNTAKTQGSGYKLDGVNIDSVLAGSIAIQNLNQLRFGNSGTWDWNQWAGIKYDSTTHNLFIGGPASSVFSANASPPQINVMFDGITGMSVGKSTSPSYMLDVNGDIQASGAVRIKGISALTFQDYGGGWNMTDATWIRTTGNKNIYHNTGLMRTDGTLQVGNNGSTLNVINGGAITISGTVTNNTEYIAVSTASFENHIKFQSPNGTSTGFYANTASSAIGMYDWTNGRSVWKYAPSTNIFSIDSPSTTMNGLSATNVTGNTFTEGGLSLASKYLKLDGTNTITGTVNINYSGNPGIELRSSSGGTPYIDFSSGNIENYDARIIYSGGVTPSLSIVGSPLYSDMGVISNGSNGQFVIKENGTSKWGMASVGSKYMVQELGGSIFNRLVLSTHNDSDGGQLNLDGSRVTTARDSWDDNGGYLTVNTAGWYRIAHNIGSRAHAKFTLLDTYTGKHHAVSFIASVAYNNSAKASVNVLSDSFFGSGTIGTFGGIRLATATQYDPMYLDIYINAPAQVRVIMEDNWWTDGWVFENWTSNTTLGGTYTPNYYWTDGGDRFGQMQVNGHLVWHDGTLIVSTSTPSGTPSKTGAIWVQY